MKNCKIPFVLKLENIFSKGKFYQIFKTTETSKLYNLSGNIGNLILNIEFLENPEQCPNCKYFEGHSRRYKTQICENCYH